MRLAAHSNSSDARRLLFLVDTIADIVWEADLHGKIVYANRHWYEYIDKEPSDETTDSWVDYLHPDDVDIASAAWQHSLDTGDPFEIEYRLKEAKTGEYNWFLARAMPFLNQDNEIERWYGTCTNIDPTKENEKLLALNRSKDEFISIASHQLRTPATGVKQYLGMLLENMFGELTDSQRDIITRAYQSNERQLSIITDLLRVAQLDAGDVLLHPMTTDINELVHYIIQDLSGVFRNRSQELEYRPFKGGALTLVDAEAIRMVIENIIENASKYSEENTRVVVSVKRSNDQVQIRVADNGVGIKAADRHLLFDRFSRIANPLSEKVGGTGLGLYLAKHVVDLHGGKITLQNNKPHGSIFTVHLPALAETVTNLTESE